jgi:hypothetical protein
METITSFFLGRWWSHLASIASMGFGAFCLISILRKNPLFKTKDRSKQLMPYKHQVLWTLFFGGFFLILGSYLLLESIWTFNSSYEGKIVNRYISGSQRDGTPHHYFQIFTKDGIKKISVTQEEYNRGQKGFYIKKPAKSFHRTIEAKRQENTPQKFRF